MAFEAVSESKKWNSFMASLNQPIFFQSWEWGELKRAHGWGALRLLDTSPAPVAAIQILFKKVAPGLVLAYAPQGPGAFWTPNFNDALRELMAIARAACRTKGAFVLRVDPFLLVGSPEARAALQLLNEVGFKKSFEEVQAQHTILLDLTKSPDELLAAMPKKGRYSIKLAERKGVTVREAGLTEGLDRFWRLYEETASRLKFPSRSKSYFRKLAALLEETAAGTFIETYFGDNLLSSSWIVYFGGRATYLYGASSNRYRELMPSYLGQWTAILKARERGLKIYDFWGVVKTHDLAHHWAGYSHFKRQFGGEEVSYIGAYDLVISPLKYHSYRLAQQTRKKVFGLREE